MGRFQSGTFQELDLLYVHLSYFTFAFILPFHVSLSHIYTVPTILSISCQVSSQYQEVFISEQDIRKFLLGYEAFAIILPYISCHSILHFILGYFSFPQIKHFLSKVNILYFRREYYPFLAELFYYRMRILKPLSDYSSSPVETLYTDCQFLARLITHFLSDSGNHSLDHCNYSIV